MGNPTTPSGMPARCQPVNWCVSPLLAPPHGDYHIGDLASLVFGVSSVDMEIYRHVDETDPAKALVRVTYSEVREQKFHFDFTPDVAWQVAEVIRKMPLQTVPDFVAALRDGRRKLERERPR